MDAVWICDENIRCECRDCMKNYFNGGECSHCFCCMTGEHPVCFCPGQEEEYE